jgi:hypothetical protein
VPKIVEPWLVAGSVESQYSGLLSQPLELMAGMIVSEHHANLCREDCRWALISHTWTMPPSVKFQDADKILSDWNQPGLAELGFSNRQCGILEIRILVLQASGLAQLVSSVSGVR